MAKKRKGRSGRTTQRGYASPSAPARAEAGPPEPRRERDSEAPPTLRQLHDAERERRPDPLEVEWVREHGPPTLLSGPWRAVEIWTRNHIYVLDSSLECMDVIDRGTGRADGRHAMLGSKLFGGQKRADSGAITEVSHPMPRPGAQAVFGERVGRRFSLSETSPVTRVVMRNRVVTMGSIEKPPSWEEITGEHSADEE